MSGRVRVTGLSGTSEWYFSINPKFRQARTEVLVELHTQEKETVDGKGVAGVMRARRYLAARRQFVFDELSLQHLRQPAGIA